MENISSVGITVLEPVPEPGLELELEPRSDGHELKPEITETKSGTRIQMEPNLKPSSI